MLKQHFITGASIVLIVISIYGLLKTTFHVQPVQSKPATTLAATPTTTPKVLPAATAATPEPTPELTPTSTPEPTPTPKPLKSRVVKHQPDQFRRGALSREELSAIKKAIRTITWSRNPDPKAAADEDYAAMVRECQNSNVRYHLADLITEAESNEYKPDDEEATRIYITELNANFEAGVREKQD
jgi:type IV secretory pathway VirB10-like protein